MFDLLIWACGMFGVACLGFYYTLEAIDDAYNG